MEKSVQHVDNDCEFVYCDTLCGNPQIYFLVNLLPLINKIVIIIVIKTIIIIIMIIIIIRTDLKQVWLLAF